MCRPGRRTNSLLLCPMRRTYRSSTTTTYTPITCAGEALSRERKKVLSPPSFLFPLPAGVDGKKILPQHLFAIAARDHRKETIVTALFRYS